MRIINYKMNYCGEIYMNKNIFFYFYNPIRLIINKEVFDE